MSEKEYVGTGKLQVIRARKLCSSTCPAFNTCAVMPMALKPDNPAERLCLVNAGPHNLRMAWINLFLHGETGLEDEIKNRFVKYMEEFDKLETQMRKESNTVTTKERERLLVHHEKMMGMLLTMKKVLYGEIRVNKADKPADQPILIREVKGGDDTVLLQEDRPLTEEEEKKLLPPQYDDPEPEPEPEETPVDHPILEKFFPKEES